MTRHPLLRRLRRVASAGAFDLHAADAPSPTVTPSANAALTPAPHADAPDNRAATTTSSMSNAGATRNLDAPSSVIHATTAAPPV